MIDHHLWGIPPWFLDAGGRGVSIKVTTGSEAYCRTRLEELEKQGWKDLRIS